MQNRSIIDKARRSDPVVIRGHNLLCLQGFRGEGYSRAFIDGLATIHRTLSDDPARLTQVVQRPDDICHACPHLKLDGCHLNGPGSEREVKVQDREVMGRLGIAEGEVLPWGEILLRISKAVTGESLQEICGGCRWLPLGYCREGIDRLKIVNEVL